MKSRQALVNRAFSLLGESGEGQAPSAEQYALIDGDVEPVLGNLLRRGIYPFGDPDQIEDEAFVDLSIVLRNHSAAHFSIPADNEALRLAESRLREVFAETLSYQPLKATYY